MVALQVRKPTCWHTLSTRPSCPHSHPLWPIWQNRSLFLFRFTKVRVDGTGKIMLSIEAIQARILGAIRSSYVLEIASLFCWNSQVNVNFWIVELWLFQNKHYKSVNFIAHIFCSLSCITALNFTSLLTNDRCPFLMSFILLYSPPNDL